MKKARIFALLCAVVLLVGITSAASAGAKLSLRGSTVTRAMAWNRPVYLNNGETLTLISTGGSTFYDENGNDVGDVLFQCAGAVKAKTTDAWIYMKETSQSFAITGLGYNDSLKSRVGTITVTGSSYSAKLKIVQLGRDLISSMTRNKKTITVKFNLSDADFHFVRVEKTKVDKDGNVDWSTTTYPIHTILKGNKLTFTAEKGYRYYVNVGPVAYIREYGSMGITYTGSAYMIVQKVTGTQTADYISQ